MATTNFLQFDPFLNNADSDSAYLADSLRSGGITTGAILPSTLLNKAWYQWSTFVAAFCQMMVNKGYSPLDSNFANLVSVLTNVKTTADFLTSILTVTFNPTIAFNAAQTAQWWLTLTGNVTSSTLTGQVQGQNLIFIITQDATGGRTFSWPTNITGAGAISTQANVTSIQMFDVLPNGTIYPITQMLWVSASGVVAQSRVNVVSLNTSGNVSNAYEEILEKIDASSGAITRNLYNVVGFKGFKVDISKYDPSVNPVNINAFSGQTILGSFSQIQIFPQYNSFSLVADGISDWTLI